MCCQNKKISVVIVISSVQGTQLLNVPSKPCAFNIVIASELSLNHFLNCYLFKVPSFMRYMIDILMNIDVIICRQSSSAHTPTVGMD